MVYAIILAGGKGERFWPRSRESKPKQLLPLVSAKTMLEETIDRILPLIPPENVLIVTTSELRDTMKNIFIGLKQPDLLLEPFGRNTAPAIAYAASYLYKKDKDAVMICLPADHYIKENDRFLSSVKKAISLARDNWLVTFGIPPSRPDTEYGYIEVGDKIEKGVYTVRNFKEKPTKKRAVEFLKQKNFLWNSGMFVWKVEIIINEIRKHAPYIYEKLFTKQQLDQDGLIEIYDSLPAISIDYAVMERSTKTAVLKGNFTWDDVGSWLSLERLLGKDDNGNTIMGEAFIMDSKNCIISNENRITALLGVSDIIIINTDDALFVCNKTHTERIKKFIEIMEEDNRFKKYL